MMATQIRPLTLPNEFDPTGRGDARRMPTPRSIREHWAGYLVRLGKADSRCEVVDEEWCFGCGDSGIGLQRAHIMARVSGGGDKPGNLHMLCRNCHLGTELMEPEEYFEKFPSINFINVGPMSEISKAISEYSDKVKVEVISSTLFTQAYMGAAVGMVSR